MHGYSTVEAQVYYPMYIASVLQAQIISQMLNN